MLVCCQRGEKRWGGPPIVCERGNPQGTPEQEEGERRERVSGKRERRECSDWENSVKNEKNETTKRQREYRRARRKRRECRTERGDWEETEKREERRRASRQREGAWHGTMSLNGQAGEDEGERHKTVGTGKEYKTKEERDGRAKK